MKTIDKHLCKALDSYPFQLEETIESLEYALSYDRYNPITLCMFGRVYAEQFLNYSVAKEYYQEALAADLSAVYVYPFFIQMLIESDECEEAEKLISFALTIKGINKPLIISKYVSLLEKCGKYKKAKKWLQKLQLQAVQDDFLTFIKDTESRIKTKKSLSKKKDSNKK
jgi:tetratricopeptide (TPR) repeat protein